MTREFNCGSQLLLALLMASWRCSIGCPHQRVDGFDHHSTPLLKRWGQSGAPVQVRQKCGLGGGPGAPPGRACSGAPPTVITRAPCSQLQAQQKGSGSPVDSCHSISPGVSRHQTVSGMRACLCLQWRTAGCHRRCSSGERAADVDRAPGLTRWQGSAAL